MILPPSLAELDKRQTFEQEARFKTQLHHKQGSLKKWLIKTLSSSDNHVIGHKAIGIFSFIVLLLANLKELIQNPHWWDKGGGGGGGEGLGE